MFWYFCTVPLGRERCCQNLSRKSLPLASGSKRVGRGQWRWTQTVTLVCLQVPKLAGVHYKDIFPVRSPVRLPTTTSFPSLRQCGLSQVSSFSCAFAHLVEESWLLASWWGSQYKQCSLLCTTVYYILFLYVYIIPVSDLVRHVVFCIDHLWVTVKRNEGFGFWARLSVRMEQLVSHWTGFHEIW